MKLQDPAHTKVLIVTLPETTPVLEASRLQNDLRRAAIEPFAWIINGALSPTGTADPLLRARAASEGDVIARVTGSLAVRTHLVPWQAEPPVGTEALRHLVRGSLSRTAR
jgi:arsenite-transporting ATPase